MRSVVKKLAWLTVAVAIVLAAVLAMTVGAEQPAPTLAIKGFNVSLRDAVCLKYGVAAENAGEVKLLIWTEPQEEYVLGTQKTELTSVGASGGMLVFDYTGLAAKQMTDVIYSRAYTEVDGEIYYSDVRSYSVLEYLYTQLGYIGNKPTTKPELISLIEVMMEYGAAAQKFLDYNTDRLATDKYYQVTVEGGVLPDGMTSGLYKSGDSITLSAPATNGELEFSHWADSAENKVSTSATATLTVGSTNETYTAVYGVFEDDLRVEYIYDESDTYIIGVKKYDDKDQLVYEEERYYDDTYTSYDKDVILYTYHRNGEVKSITGYENDVLYGYVEYDDHGNRAVYKWYENGQLVEDYIYNYEYYSNGEPKKATLYLNGVLYAYAEFNEYGDCTLEQEYDENGQLVDTWLYQLEYHSNGEKKSEKSFVNGILRHHHEFNEYGDRTVFRYYSDGVLVGEETSEYEYYEDGAVKKITAYENGDLIYIEEYDKNGNVTCSEYYDIDGEVIKKTFYSYDGDGLIEYAEYWYEDGELAHVDTYNGDHTIIKQDYYEQGVLAYYAVYEYHDNGLKKSEAAYDVDGSIVFIVRWDDQGYRTYEYDTWRDSDGNMGYSETNYYPGTYMPRSHTEYCNGKLVEIQEWDENGNSTKDESYDLSGNLTQKSVYSYNEDGEFVGYVKYEYENGLPSYVSVYDDNWNHVKWDIYEDGVLVRYATYEYYPDEYDEEGYLVKEGAMKSSAMYTANGKMFVTRRYDEQGNETYVAWYDSEGKLEEYSEACYYPDTDQKKSYTEYYADGSVKLVEEFDENGNYTKFESYDEDGNLAAKDAYYYEDGVCVKTECYYYENGVLDRIETYDGDWNELKRENYEDGVLSTYCIYERYNDGSLRSEDEYNADDVLTHKNCYDEQGNRTYEYSSAWDSDGNCTGSSEFYYYSNGMLQSHIQYYADGTVRSVGEWTEDGRCTKNERYDENGNLTQKIIDHYNGTERARSTVYMYENGVLTSIIEADEFSNTTKWEIYENGELSFYETYEYYDNGVRKSAIRYNPDGSVAWENRYDENGNLIF